jgi:hypothetical protein
MYSVVFIIIQVRPPVHRFIGDRSIHAEDFGRIQKGSCRDAVLGGSLEEKADQRIGFFPFRMSEVYVRFPIIDTSLATIAAAATIRLPFAPIQKFPCLSLEKLLQFRQSNFQLQCPSPQVLGQL